MVRVRFAPSPTGPLHVGGARTALFNFLFARREGGTFVLRIDDTDAERSKAEYETDILDSLRWLGLEWDEGPERGSNSDEYRQSKRRARHLEAIDQLIRSKAAYKDDGGAVRLRYRSGVVVVDDLVCGRCEFTQQALGPEPVLLRSDGNPTYHLASVVDDIDMKITHVIRGQDHLTNTAKHKVMFEAFGSGVPQFAHLPLLLGTDGAKLSKRSQTDLTLVSEFRSGGYLAEAMLNFLMLLGWSHPEAHDQITVEEAVRTFSLERVKRTGAIFDPQKLNWLNAWWIRHLEISDLTQVAEPFLGAFSESMKSRGRSYATAFYTALREEMHFLTDAESLASLCLAEIPLSPINTDELRGKKEWGDVGEAWRSLLNETATADGNDAYTEAEFRQMVNMLKKKFTLDGKSLFHALRLVITGRLAGPELKTVVPLIPRSFLIKRAEHFTKILKEASAG